MTVFTTALQKATQAKQSDQGDLPLKVCFQIHPGIFFIMTWFRENMLLFNVAKGWEKRKVMDSTQSIFMDIFVLNFVW